MLSTSRISVVAVLVAILPIGFSAHAQEATHLARQGASGSYPTVRLVKKLADGAVYEMNADWSRSLRTAVDSAGADRLTTALARQVTRGVPVVSQHLWLPARRAPRVRVMAADYEEVQLPADSVSATLTRAPAEALGIGMERRRPAATLVFRAVRYDEDAQRLRRYGRLRVRVTFNSNVQAQQKSVSSATAMTNAHLSVERSALADGMVFKFPIAESGIYSITRDELAALLEDADRSIDEVDPARLQVFGNSGASLPALAGASRAAGLIENPVRMKGGSDGSFDDGDVLTFYAQGPRGWRYSSKDDQWTHYVNPYANSNYYFLKIEGEKGLRVETDSPAGAETNPIRQVTGRYFVENDEYNWSPRTYGSGRTWVSTTFEAGQEHRVLDDTNLPGRVAGAVRYHARFALQAQSRSYMAFKSGEEMLKEASVWSVSQPERVARPEEVTFEQDVSNEGPLNLSAIARSSGEGAVKAAVDWLRVFYPKQLNAENGKLRWATPPEQSGTTAFQLSGFGEAPQVWDVTKPGAVRRLETEPANGGFRVQTSVSAPKEPHELIAFSPEAVRSAPLENAISVENQNLHGLETYPDLVIVTPEIFLDEAKKLAQHREDQGLRVLVAERDKIRNEFSGGKPDMRAARDFFKFLYDRAPQGRLLRYALFFGDGHFNYRGLGKEKPKLENHLFPYETKNSFDEDDSFTSDDYFGLLDDDEGRWPYYGYSHKSDERVDIGIGRLPVQKKEEADALLKKMRQYEEVRIDSPWHLRYTFVADDGPTGASGNKNDENLHVNNAETAARAVRNAAPLMNQQKLYGPSYERRYLNGWRLPELHRDLQEAFREGTAVLNYSGHGAPNVLAQERIFTSQDARNLFNPDRPALVITATCAFGRWDMARQQSAAEELLLNPEGGAAVLFTTVRTVYTTNSDVSLNPGLNRQINLKLFTRTQGRARRLGDAMRLTKNTGVGLQGNSRKFNLLGDPSMRVTLPRYKAELETVNGKPLSDGSRVPLRALDKVRVTGSVREAKSGKLAGDFNGRAYFTVYDKERRVMLPYGLGDSYETRQDQLWRGQGTVAHGHFEANFRVPKDISYSDDPGRISVYATTNSVDAGGYTEQVTVGGTADDPENDRQGPQVDLFINDSTFISGGTAPTGSKIVAEMEDQTGLNAGGAGVGHEILLTIDGDRSNAVDLGPYFQTKPNSYQEGRIEYDLDKYPAPLEAGPHSAELTAWDVANNSQTARLDFTLTDAANGKLALSNVYNVPNPTTTAGAPTRFIIEHNQPSGTQANVRLRIYTLSGRPVRTLRNADLKEGGLLHAGPLQIRWNGRDEDGDPLAPGVYLYRVRVAVDAEGDRQVAERIEKLAVIR